MLPPSEVEEDRAILSSIHADEYGFLREMILKGWRPNVAQCSSLYLSIRENGVVKQWDLCDATPLHYALCCGSFAAAAAFFIAFPHHAELCCRAQSPDGQISRWTALDLAIFLANVLLSTSVPRAQQFQQASICLIRFREKKLDVPFLVHPTPSARLAAAGNDAASAIAALTRDPACDTPRYQGQRLALDGRQ